MSSVNSVRSDVSIFVNNEGTVIGDRDDQCTKSVISSFELTEDAPSSPGMLDGPRIIFHLKPVDSVDVKCLKEDGTELRGNPVNKFSLAVNSAAQSIVKLMHAPGYVGKDIVAFQCRERGAVIGSHFIPLTHDGRPIPKSTAWKPNFNQGIVSHTYAYLDEEQLCVFLHASAQDTWKKIDELLAKHFPRAQKGPVVDESKEIKAEIPQPLEEKSTEGAPKSTALDKKIS